MSLRDISMFYVLGEDAAHRSFIRNWLIASGVTPRCIHTVEPPADKSGGSWFVIHRCEETVREARHRDRSRAKTRVIVALDADDGTVQDRISEIRGVLGADDSLDLVCILVPKRHIETWVHALGPARPAVDEHADYKPKTIDEVKSAGRTLARLSSAPSEPPSLVHGYGQLQRFRGAP